MSQKTQNRLIEEVIEKGICVACGACLGLCPYFHYFDGKVVVMDRCSSDRGRCVQLCPQVDLADTAFDQMIANGNDITEIGSYKKIVMARSLDEEIGKRAQYGGVVSSLLTHALEKGIIQSAILTDAGGEYAPSGKITRSRSSIIDCAGSRYTASAGLEALNAAINAGERKLGVVGLPCQMEALARMKLMDPDGKEQARRITLRIGLFCTWALDYRSLFAHLKKAGLKGPISKYDIPPPPARVFQVLTENGGREFPLDDVRPFIKKGCSLCLDMTAEWADISVGTVEGLDGWNTVILRTSGGLQLMEKAIEDSVVEVDDLSRGNLKHLREASIAKKESGRLTRREMRQKGI